MVSRVERIASEIKNNRLAEIAEASDETIQKVAKMEKVASSWSQIKAGRILLVGSRKFKALGIEPTRDGSPVAWVRGYWLNRAGNAPMANQIFHLHCPEGQRMELMSIDAVKVLLK